MAKALEINWKFEPSNDLYRDIGMREASGIHTNENKITHYIGLYQLGEAALVDAGYYKKALALGQKPGDQYNNDWTGKWTGKHQVNSKHDFMSNRTVQDIAVREYHQIVWKYLKDYHKYEGQEIGGIVLTKSGMIAAGHLVGHTKVKKFIDTNGVIDKEDGNNIPCSDYLKKFGGYDVDYSTEKLIKELELEWQQHQATGSADKSAFDMSNIEKVLKYSEICEKLNDKFNKILEKFVEQKQKELEEYIASTKTELSKQFKDMESEAHGVLDAKKSELEASGEAVVKAALAARIAAMSSRKSNCPEGETVYISTADVAAEETIKANTILIQLVCQIQANLNKKRTELDIKCNKTISEKKDIVYKQLNTKKEQVDNYLSQILSKMEVGVTNNSEQTLESDAEQFANQLQQELLGSETQLEHAA